MLSVEIRGGESIRDTLKNLSLALDRREILDESGAVLLNIIRTRYRAEVSPEGEKWKRSKAAIREGRATLFRTGRLFHSLQLSSSGPDSRTIGTDVPYGKYHQFGTKKMVRRMFLGFNDRDAEIIEALLVARLRRVGAV